MLANEVTTLYVYLCNVPKDKLKSRWNEALKDVSG